MHGLMYEKQPTLSLRLFGICQIRSLRGTAITSPERGDRELLKQQHFSARCQCRYRRITETSTTVSVDVFLDALNAVPNFG